MSSRRSRSSSGKPGRKVCEAMRGLVEEAQHELEEHDKGPVLDLVIVASQQRIEHYEIAAYGTMVELSKALGETKVADLLAGILAEEKAQDEKLAESNSQHHSSRGPGRSRESDESEDDEEDNSEEEEGGGQSESAPKRSKKSSKSSARRR